MCETAQHHLQAYCPHGNTNPNGLAAKQEGLFLAWVALFRSRFVNAQQVLVPLFVQASTGIRECHKSGEMSRVGVQSYKKLVPHFGESL